MNIVAEKHSDWLDADDKERLPLGPVTAWEVGRMVTVAHMKQLAQSSQSGHPVLRPTEIRVHLIKELGWNPSNHSLYNGILKPLRLDGGLQRQIRHDLTGATEGHPLTLYQPGAQMTEIWRIRQPKVADRLETSATLLSNVSPKLAEAADGAESTAPITTNTATLMRWLCLWTLRNGPLAMPDLRRTMKALSGADWPSSSMTYRAVDELSTEPFFAVIQSEERPRTLSITPHGRTLLATLAAALQEPVAQALRFAEAAKAILQA